MKCYVCEQEATVIRTGNAVCEFHAGGEGFEELERKVLRDFFGDEPYLGDYKDA